MTFIGDRFVSVGHHWLDIVSGRHVAVRTGAAPSRIDERERLCRERWAVVSPGGRLIDFGRQGSCGWFEAEAPVAVAPPEPMRQLLWPQIAGVVNAIAEERAGAHVTIEAPRGAGFQTFCDQLARRLREVGFVAVRADAPIPYRLRRLLMHRHLVIIAMNDAASAFVAGWLAQLAMVSDRKHVVIERLEGGRTSGMRLRPFDCDALIEAATCHAATRGVGADENEARTIAEAAAASGGWPAAFVRRWSSASPARNVARERALAVDEEYRPGADHHQAVRAATYARRRRPVAESHWHSAAVAAARRRGDGASAIRATERWVERLVDEGRYSRAIAVALGALRECDDNDERIALSRLAARAHLAAADVTRAETLINAAIAAERLNGGAARPSTCAVLFEVMFWKGRWEEIRAALADRPDIPDRDEWLGVLEWADRGSVLDAPPGAEIVDGYFMPRPVGRRGLADAIAIAIRRSLGRAEPAEAAWFDDLVRREQLRGLARFSQGKSTMQMLRDMATLLEIVQSAEDEASGLARVCGWVRTAAGATACGVVTTAGAVVAGDALRALGLEAHETARWAEHADAEFAEDGTRATASAPIRLAGATLGAIVATGADGCGRAIANAVQAAAAVCGSLVKSRLDALASAAHGEALAGEILGASPAIRGVRASVARVAIAPFSVVIEGESGTGKELVARALHRHSQRRDRAFAALNCAALTDELIEAELFGHARGAFTHAVNARTGLFEDAHRGTLFLDEVGELSPRAQAKLLRTLQEGEIRRVGENDSRPVDVRVIAATNRPLAMLAAEGRFREDLMFRLSVVKIAVPPLRERAEDIPQLALEFWRSSARRVEPRATLGPDAIALLAEMPWPGNVRQLQNAMSALAVAAPKAGRVGARLVRLVLDGLVETGAAEIVPLDEARRQVERRVVAAALARYTGNRADAARALGLSRQGLAKALRRLGLAEAGAA